MMKNIFTTIILLTTIMFCINLQAAEEELVGFDLTVDVSNTLCTNNGGIVAFQMTGGVQPYSIMLTGLVDQVFEVDDTVFSTFLLPGNYSVSVVDAAGCQESTVMSIGSEPLVVSIDCNGDDDSVFANVIGGILPYSYEWSNGSSLAEQTNLDEGIYFITVTDANGCETIVSYLHASFDGTLNCNQEINISVVEGSTITADILIEGPGALCNADYVFNLTDSQGTELRPFASSQEMSCSFIGELSYTLREVNSGVECSGTILVEDKLPPTPYCLSLPNILLEDTQEKNIYANEFDLGSFDNCSSDLRFTFSSTPPDNDPNFDPALGSSFLTVDCDYTLGPTTISIYVWDEAGNSNFCVVPLFVNHDGQCDVDGNFLEVVDGPCNVGGLNRYDLLLNGSEIENLGCFYPLDDNINSGTNVITLSNGDGTALLNGISTLDLVLSVNGLVEGYASPLEAVLADIDGDLAISTQDLVLIRLVILGVITEIDAPHYKIFPFDLEFPSDFNQYDQQNSYTTYEFDGSQLGNVNRVNIYKSGDLNNSALFTEEISTINRSVAKITFDDIDMLAGQTYFIEFEATADDAIKAATFELEAEGLDVKSIDNQGFDILDNSDSNSSKISFVDYATDETFKFTMEVVATQNIAASDALSISNEFLNEVAFNDLSLTSFSLSANEVTAIEDVLEEELIIFPNPTTDVVNLEFGTSFTGEKKQVEIISLDGRIVYAQTTMQDQLNIDLVNLQTQGMHLVKVQVGDKSILKKLIIK